MHSSFMASGKVIAESPGPRGGRKKSDNTLTEHLLTSYLYVSNLFRQIYFPLPR